MVAVNWVELTKVVVRALPFQFTTEPEVKSLPVTVRVKAGSPAVALEGEIDITEGMGFGWVMVPLELESHPPSTTRSEKTPNNNTQRCLMVASKLLILK